MRTVTNMRAIFNSGLEIELTMNQINDMSHTGDCSKDVNYHIEQGVANQLKGKEELIKQELQEYGAWDENELSDNDANIVRILWIAAGNLKDELDNLK